MVLSGMMDDDMNLATEKVCTDFGGISERRETTRFPVCEELKYKIVQGKTVTSGAGKTLNIGSGGVLFTTEQRLPLGRMVELSVNWPARLDGTCPLKFVATGRIIRSESDRAAVRIERYEFRTRSMRQ
jgi:PilZ domain